MKTRESGFGFVALAMLERRRVGGIEEELRCSISLRIFFVFLKYAAKTEKHDGERTHENNCDHQRVN